MPGVSKRQQFAIGAIAGAVLFAPLTYSVWPALVIAVAAGLFLAADLAAPKFRAWRAAQAERRTELRERAEQQHGWVLRGDNRGIFGPEGADLMRTVVAKPPPARVPWGPDAAVDIAVIAYTEEDLATLLRERPAGWHWAAFGSVLVQRRAKVQSRLRDQQLCYAPPSGESVDTDYEAVELAQQWANDMLIVVHQGEQLMLSRGFQSIFEGSFNEDTVDADTVVHTANRLMDLHDRLLKLSERCRGLAAPSWCSELFAALGALIDVPLDGFGRFIDDYLASLAEIPDMLRFARGSVELGPVLWDLNGHEAVIDRFSAQLREMSGP